MEKPVLARRRVKIGWYENTACGRKFFRYQISKLSHTTIYYLEAFLKVSGENVAQKEEIIDFLFFAFINWSERCFIMGPVLGDRLV